MNPAFWLKRTSLKNPCAPALFDGTEQIADYQSFANRAAAIGQWLTDQGITPGMRVALFAKNCPEYLMALYGIWWVGAVAVPINAKLHVREAAWISENAGAKIMLCDASAIPAFNDIGAVSWKMVDLHQVAHNCGEIGASMPAPMQPNDLLWLFYTSGTTGKPKGVMITCANISAMVMSYLIDVDDVYDTDAILYAAPMSHGAGLYNFMHILRGARHVVPKSGGFDAAELLELAPKVGPVSMFAAPTMVRRMIDAAKSSPEPGAGIRTVVYAGGPMYEADIIEAVSVMGARFVQIYGQGECPMGITALGRADITDRSHENWRARLNSVGRAQSQVDVCVVDKNGSALPVGLVGEIAVKGATVMAGYWQNEAATNATLQDGWLMTGDMGKLDADGYLTLHDRSKDVIISGGSNIYPREVEEVLLSHAGVNEASIVGQKHPEWGEIVVAFIVRNDNTLVAPEELDALCLQHLARFKRPKSYYFVTELPKNNYGKVLKTKLRAQLSDV